MKMFIHEQITVFILEEPSPKCSLKCPLGGEIYLRNPPPFAYTTAPDLKKKMTFFKILFARQIIAVLVLI